MQITGVSIKNVKVLFLILNHCNCINSNGIKQQLLLSRSVRSPFVGFVSVMDKSFVRRRVVVDIC